MSWVARCDMLVHSCKKKKNLCDLLVPYSSDFLKLVYISKWTLCSSQRYARIEKLLNYFSGGLPVWADYGP